MLGFALYQDGEVGPPGAGFGVEKPPSGMAKISTLGVLRLRATKRCVTPQICEALRSHGTPGQAG